MLLAVKQRIIGSALGLLGPFGIYRLFAAAFPGMQTSSVPVLTGATVLLIAIAQIAWYLPENRLANQPH